MQISKLYLLVLLVLLGPSVCISQEVLPYWEAEVFEDWHRVPDSNALTTCRELVAPNDGKYTVFSQHDIIHKRYKEIQDVYQKLSPDEREFLVEFDEAVRTNPGCQAPIMVQLSSVQNDKGFHPVEGLCLLFQDGPDELFLFPSEWCLPQYMTLDLGDLKGLTRLKHLEIFGYRLKQLKTENLSKLKSLEYLGLPHDSDDAILDEVAFLERLEFLNAAGTHITGRGFDNLAVLDNLKILDLRYTRLTEDAISKLKDIKSLKTLLLTGAEVTDRHLEGLDEMKGLQNLALSNTQITDATLKKIETLPNLRYLTLGGVPVTRQRIQSLRRSNPDLTISLEPVMSLGEYKRRDLYRKATLLGDVDAQLFFSQRYLMGSGNRTHPTEPEADVNLNDYFRTFSKSGSFPADRIELLKWIYVILDPRNTPQEVEWFERHLPRRKERKELLEKEMHLHERAESRRRADVVLTLQTHYDIAPAKRNFDYLPTYQITFSASPSR